MKTTHLFLVLIFSCLLFSCSKEDETEEIISNASWCIDEELKLTVELRIYGTNRDSIELRSNLTGMSDDKRKNYSFIIHENSRGSETFEITRTSNKFPYLIPVSAVVPSIVSVDDVNPNDPIEFSGYVDVVALDDHPSCPGRILETSAEIDVK